MKASNFEQTLNDWETIGALDEVHTPINVASDSSGHDVPINGSDPLSDWAFGDFTADAEVHQQRLSGHYIPVNTSSDSPGNDVPINGSDPLSDWVLGDFTYTSDAKVHQQGLFVRYEKGDYYGTSGNNEVIAVGSNSHKFYGFNGNDSLIGGNGDDRLYGGNGNDILRGYWGKDFIDGGSGNDEMTGGADDDTMLGGSGIDNMDGGEGQDWMEGGDDDDWMNGGAGNDTMFGGAGKDMVDGGTGDDTIYGGDNNDAVFGNDGNDNIWGDAGDDVIFGGNGNDILRGNAGNDRLTGGAGFDQFVFDHDAPLNSQTNVDTIVDFTKGEDKIALASNIFGAMGGPLGQAGGTITLTQGTSAVGNKAQLIYDRASGDLWYDADGQGGQDAIKFAHMENHADLNAGNFFLY